VSLFSIRYKKALDDGSLELRVPQKLRNSMARTCERYDPLDELEGIRQYSLRAEAFCLRVTGEEKLCAHSQSNQAWVDGDFYDVLHSGRRTMVMDLIESFLKALPDDQAYKCEQELNECLRNHGSEWRLAGGNFFKIDSIFLAEEIDARAQMLLEAAGFEGARYEFAQARTSLTAGDTHKAVVMANNALESTMKCLLGQDRGKPGELIRWTIDKGLVPEYFEGFLKAFERILYTVTCARSQPRMVEGIQSPMCLQR